MKVRHVRLIGALFVVALAYAAAPPGAQLKPDEVLRRFSFTSSEPDDTFGLPVQNLRPVHRSLRHIAPWISAVGSGVALGDLDGDLKPDDECDVDTRIDRVVVRSVSGKYPSFPLPHAAGPHPARAVAPMGCLIGDFNEDGLPDILVYFWGRPPVIFLRTAQARQPGSTVLQVRADTFMAVDVAPAEQRWFTSAVTLADVDGDGHQDLVVGNYFCFGGRVLEAGTDEPACPHPVMQDSMSRAFNGGIDRILMWRSALPARPGAGPAVGYADLPDVFPKDVEGGWTLAIGAQDLNGDGLPDLYFGNDFGPDRLLVNCSHAEASFGASREQMGCFPLQGPVSFRLVEGRRGLTTPGSKVLGRDSFKGMGVDFADLDGDGLPDLFVSNITERWALHESNFAFLSGGRPFDARRVRDGVAPYVDHSEPLGLSRSGWAWDNKLADFDNDGVPEVLQAVGFARGDKAGAALVWRKSCWSLVQELATANDQLLKHPETWFDMAADPPASTGCDLSGSTANPFFVRTSSGRYEDVAGLLFADHDDPRAPSRGIAVADTDHDGRLDFAVGRQYAPPQWHHNTSHAALQNRWIGFIPRFVVDDAAAPAALVDADAVAARELPSRPAYGVVARLSLSDGRVLTLQVDGGNGHSGKRSPELHAGLGPASAGVQVRSVEFSWRAGPDAALHRVRFQDPRPGRYQVAFLAPHAAPADGTRTALRSTEPAR